MSATIAALRGKGNIWDPTDDEWCDAAQLAETFNASHRIPHAVPHATEQSRLSAGLGAAMQAAPSGLLTEEDEEKEKIEELGNTYYSNPLGDLNDKVMQSVLGTRTVYFAAAVAAPRSMHVVDLDAYFCTADKLLQYARPRLGDAVATILSHTNAACLSAFLNPLVKEFVFRRKVNNNEGGLILVIRREHNEVICGAYRNLGFKMLWKVYVKSVVGVTGEWCEVFAAGRTGEMVVDKGVPEWGTVRTGGEVEERTSESVQRKLELSPSKKTVKAPEDVGESDPKLMLYRSRVLATHLLWDIWSRFDGKYECRATWTADGEESVVRLSRSVVGGGEEDA
ncbi:hypothetical protein BDU57DRAFT_544477 [Ampelomyces quisqualis]|uniref:Uncharacterized protein n=1 Tax=Ampelomyces quisqualis TaxID=50730 RepID=A0A6A5R042_AMPQU|nr:hypothetical protein BDU57DRAFT_544477 [Ampelomyces quisqualis]